MSQLVVQVTTVDQVKPHPNADRLDLAVVGEWQCVVAKDQWKRGDKAVFFPPDTILPSDVSDAFGVTQYLSKGRIKHTRLRGEPSFGLVVKPENPNWKIGTDVASYYRAEKYEPPVRSQRHSGTSSLAEDPRFSRYTDIDNLRHFPTAFIDGETVILTEKIHGANVRLGVVAGQIMAGSRRLARPRPTGTQGDTYEAATYWYPYLQHRGIRDYLASFIEPQSWWQRLLRRPRKSQTVIVYGEIYGPSIQSFDYGIPQGELGFVAFDILINGHFLNFDDFAEVCRVYHIPRVPVLYRGPYAIETVREHASGDTHLLGGDHMREGVVVRPEIERRDLRLGRMVKKYVSDDYLLDQKKTDFAEE